MIRFKCWIYKWWLDWLREVDVATEPYEPVLLYVGTSGCNSVKADLHGTTLSHAITLRQVYDVNRFV